MIKKQQEYLNYLDNVIEELKNLGTINIDKTKYLHENIKQIELIVPIIGAFSAGKSSLINSFLEKSYLPVDLTPETALATELRYSDEEYIQAIKPDDSVQIFKIDEIEKITEISHEFKFLRMYINSQKLKDIEPLILVDMPGFESPLDLHNQAIMQYINRGVHYIVLTSVEDGTITRSMERQLSNIQEYGRSFSFFLSKTNLRSAHEAKEVAQNVSEQIEEYFDMEQDVVMIDDNGGESLKRILSNIDPNSLVENIFLDDLKNNFYSIIEVINTTISTLKKDKNKNVDTIKELKESLSSLQKERDILVNEAKDRYSNNSVNRIVDYVGRELTNSLDELINLAISGAQDNMSQLISEITRSVLISKLKDSMNDISNDIIDSFSVNLSSLNSSMSELTMNDNWLEKIANTTKDMLQSGKSSLDDIVKNREKSNNNDKMYKIITTILATTTNVITPIIELVIIFLPDLLGGFFNQYKENKQKEQIRNTLLTQVIPSLKRELRAKLPEIFNKQVLEMIESISLQFENSIEEKRQTIEATQKEIDEQIINIEEKIKTYEAIKNSITTLTNKILYK